MKVLIEKDYDAVSRQAARIIAGEIRQKPDSCMALPTGGTPLGTYQELIRMHREEGLSFKGVTAFNIDEYEGMSPEDPQGYYYFLYENFYRHVDIALENTHVEDVLAEDINEACLRYEEAIRKAGGLDMAFLGIGNDGHIGFNEPGEEIPSITHLTDLTEETIRANARFFNSIDEVPRRAVTIGLGTIMKARKLLLIATGENKAEIMAQLLGSSTVTTKLPASVLWLHPDVTVIMDEAAASLVNNPAVPAFKAESRTCEV